MQKAYTFSACIPHSFFSEAAYKVQSRSSGLFRIIHKSRLQRVVMGCPADDSADICYNGLRYASPEENCILRTFILPGN
jgi:hypothetical protein